MMYVYRKSETLLWTVGYYDPDGKWQSESDHEAKEEAAKRVHYLNGGAQEIISAWFNVWAGPTGKGR